MTFREMERDAVQMGRRWLHDLLFADWGLKLLALAITLGLWFAVTGQRVPTTARMHDVRLSFVLPPDMEISNEPRDKVDVSLRGNKSALDAIRSGDVSLSYDASSYRPGERVVRLSPNNITLQLPGGIGTEGIVVERIEPSSIPLRLERRVERELVVEPKPSGQVPEGYELLGLEPMPARVRVRGPESHVNALERAPTETILLDGRKENFTASQLAIDIPDRKIVALDTVVDVQVKIAEARVTKRLDGVAARTADGSDALLTIEVRGARSYVEPLRAADLSVVFDTAADGATRPRLLLPPNLEGRIELISTNP
ncbi:MAG TPA: CdaR family protein [Pyrinomonadaceae bacterium]|nr:CdaR family protein [Pyrinomonadaceae bacterium]